VTTLPWWLKPEAASFLVFSLMQVGRAEDSRAASWHARRELFAAARRLRARSRDVIKGLVVR
jgi:hypothetical protein